MKHNSQSTLGALIIGTVIASVLASVGCADGSRHGGSNTGRKLISTTKPVGATNGQLNKAGVIATNGTTGAAGAAGSSNQPAAALPVDQAASADQKTIDKILGDYDQDLKGSAPAAGEYELIGLDAYVLDTKGTKGFATALSTYSFGTKEVSQLTSGTFEGSSGSLDLKVAGQITIAADGKVSAKTAELIVRATAERKGTNLVINVQELALTQAAPEAVSVNDLLNGAVDPAKKISIKKSSPAPGVVIVMIAEENLSDAQKNTGTNQARSVYLTFMNAEAKAAAAAEAAKQH